jgi:hypothetical protein
MSHWHLAQFKGFHAALNEFRHLPHFYFKDRHIFRAKKKIALIDQILKHSKKHTKKF